MFEVFSACSPVRIKDPKATADLLNDYYTSFDWEIIDGWLFVDPRECFPCCAIPLNSLPPEPDGDDPEHMDWPPLESIEEHEEVGFRDLLGKLGHQLLTPFIFQSVLPNWDGSPINAVEYRVEPGTSDVQVIRFHEWDDKESDDCNEQHSTASQAS